MNKVSKEVPMIGPKSVYEAAEQYIKAPETLSSDTRTILGHVYRDFMSKASGCQNEGTCFAIYALDRWKEGTFPMDALV